MNDPPRIPEGKKIVERTNKRGEKKYVVRDDPNYSGPNCWVTTAYYGDSSHPDIVILRKFLDTVMANNILRIAFQWLTRAYYAVGKTCFGRWWAKGTVKHTSKNARRFISRKVLEVLLSIARK
ncbi:MAG TPA: hypothetical protein VI387_01995 [Candidatus Brocadiales bacterium]|nr:hypothetical protein [Candidatus Brocadiales bacterium]